MLNFLFVFMFDCIYEILIFFDVEIWEVDQSRFKERSIAGINIPFGVFVRIKYGLYLRRHFLGF